MTLLTVRHISTYRYKQPVAFGEHRVMFRPRDSYDQRLLHASLRVDPEPVSVHWMHDVFGNCVACVCFSGRSTMLRFESCIELDHSSREVLHFPVSRHAEYYPFTYDTEDMPDLLRSIERHYPDPQRELADWAASFVRSRTTVRSSDLLARITHAIRQEFTYVRREEAGIQDPLLTLKRRSGSCRDFALLMMEAVRSLGFAARFVSGYLHVPSPSTSSAPARQGAGSETRFGVGSETRTGSGSETRSGSGSETRIGSASETRIGITSETRIGVGSETRSGSASETRIGSASETRNGAGSTHAWVQVYLPGAGWMEFDPTNGIVGSHDLVRVAIARDPAQAVPLWGSWIGFPSDSLGLTVEVSVTAAPDPVETGGEAGQAPSRTA